MKLLLGQVILVAALLSGAPTLALASPQWPLRVQASLDREDLELGRSFQLRLRASHGSGELVLWPEANRFGAAFAELSRKELLEAGEEGRASSELIVQLMAFDTEVKAMPPLLVQLVSSSERVHTHSLPLSVGGSADSARLQLRPVMQPVPVSVPNLPLWILLGTAPVLALFLLLALSRRRKRVVARTLEAAPAPLSAGADALAKLDALENSGLLEEQSLKGAYLSMSEILREYVGRRFDFSSLDLSSTEINARLQELSPQKNSWRKSVARWLDQSDLVKYAKSVSDSEEAREALIVARVLIEESRELAIGAEKNDEQEVASA